ncbi:MAG TPA: prephenate dehydrogenase [Bacillota bacterium]|nr:prephenate dehydrogenase [Bacillota bacterium]
MDNWTRKITILGLGLMGGSLGSALVRKGYQVSGWDQEPETVAEAFRIGAINQLPNDFKSAMKDAGVVFVATPVTSIAKVIEECRSVAAPGTIFTDLGSIKEQVIREVQQVLPAGCYFVPGHPMTGSEKHGIAGADPFLFENAAYILIEDPSNPAEVFETVKILAKATGAHVITLTAGEHDRIVAMVSHLPHLVAAILSKTAGMAEEANPGTLALAAGGFRDTTRVAMGSPQLWEDIIRGNRDKILEALALFQNELETMQEILKADDANRLRTFLTQARETRLQIPAKNKGFLTLLHEMVVTIEDRPGTIEEVLRFLSRESINIKDIEILRVREGEGGTLRLALEDSQAVDQAVRVLAAHGFKAWRR